MRVGIGYDVHRLVAGRSLVLGGVVIPHELGLAGHSDADVLLHAVMDAMLGALCLGDIGAHFSDSDAAYLGISSLRLLADVNNLVHKEGYQIANIDTVIIAEQPKIKPFVAAMSANIADTLGISANMVSIKATTTEGLGFCGRGEGIAAQAIALLTRGQVC